MRSIASGIAIGLALASCHSNKPAQDAESAKDTESSGDRSKTAESDPSKSNPLGDPSGGASAAGTDKSAFHDDSEKKDEVPCSGSTISDLIATLSQASCELAPNAPAPTQSPTKDTLDVRVSADSMIAPGATAQVRVVFRNKGTADLPLYFTVDPDPHFTFELYTAKGVRVDKPAGNEPSLPGEAADNEAADSHTARVTLSPNGTATIVLPWQAVKYKWASKEKAKGALVGRGYPREPAGPLPKGKYVLHVVTPLAHVDEGGEHELSQPRVSIEIAGSSGSESAGGSRSTATKKKH
jgi:hypothetical protein